MSEPRELSPRSGRSRIAQRFIAGTARRSIHKSAKRTTEAHRGARSILLSPVSRALAYVWVAAPALKFWAIFAGPLRGLETRVLNDE